MTNIILCAILKAKSGQKEKLRNELLKLVEPSRAEKGCIEYKLHQSLEEDRTFLFYEIWASEREINEHVNTEHYKEYEKNKEAIIDSMDVYRLENL
ncbi:putative quinol monooxygenase [Lysinibacillus fusiformis]|uniref:putative quinol monooxygenase n=1 Tax=Lysinibacillus fusiformis TaxID=28031 RepID=UPI003D06D524